MIDDNTIRKLRQLDLSELVDTLEMQEMDGETRQLAFDDRLQLCVDSLYQEKYNKRVSGLIKRSKFRIQDAEFASIHYEKREIDRQTLQELATCNYIKHRKNVIFQGDYCGIIAPPGRILDPPQAEKSSMSAEAAPIVVRIKNRKKLRQ